jgi:alpha-ketoglutaric semialdehyde dehydrogenase
MQTHDLRLSGRSLLGENAMETKGSSFRGVNPASGAELEPVFYSATAEDIDQAANLASDAFPTLAALSGRDRAALLRRIAKKLTAESTVIVDRAHLETGLPVPRLQGELVRTTNQLKLFAELLEEGSWVNATSMKPIPNASRFPAPISVPCCVPSGPPPFSAPAIFPSRSRSPEAIQLPP